MSAKDIVEKQLQKLQTDQAQNLLDLIELVKKEKEHPEETTQKDLLLRTSGFLLLQSTEERINKIQSVYHDVLTKEPQINIPIQSHQQSKENEKDRREVWNQAYVRYVKLQSTNPELVSHLRWPTTRGNWQAVAKVRDSMAQEVEEIWETHRSSTKQADLKLENGYEKLMSNLKKVVQSPEFQKATEKIEKGIKGFLQKL